MIQFLKNYSILKTIYKCFLHIIDKHRIYYQEIKITIHCISLYIYLFEQKKRTILYTQIIFFFENIIKKWHLVFDIRKFKFDEYMTRNNGENKEGSQDVSEELDGRKGEDERGKDEGE